jgi:hypothetical protein
MSSNIDLSKFLSEPSDILERLYKETTINILTKEEFENLPLNENYIKKQLYNALSSEEKIKIDKEKIKIDKETRDEHIRKFKEKYGEEEFVFDDQDPENDPLNENYIKNKEKNIDNNNERPIIHEQEQFSCSS